MATAVPPSDPGPHQAPASITARDSREQRSTVTWTNVSKEIENLLQVIPSELHASQSPEETKKIVDLLSERWKTLEELHTKKPCWINEGKRLEQVHNRYSNLKRDAHDEIKCEGFSQKLGSLPGNVGMNPGLPDQDVERDDNVSVCFKSSSASGSSRKKSLKRVLVWKMKLDLARLGQRKKQKRLEWHTNINKEWNLGA